MIHRRLVVHLHSITVATLLVAHLMIQPRNWYMKIGFDLVDQSLIHLYVDS